MQRPYGQQRGFAMLCQCAIRADTVRKHIVPLVIARHAGGTGWRLGVAGDDIEKTPRGMRPGILDIGGKLHRGAESQRSLRHIQPVKLQLRTCAGIEGQGGSRKCRQGQRGRAQQAGEQAPVQHGEFLRVFGQPSRGLPGWANPPQRSRKTGVPWGFFRRERNLTLITPVTVLKHPINGPTLRYPESARILFHAKRGGSLVTASPIWGSQSYAGFPGRSTCHGG